MPVLFLLEDKSRLFSFQMTCVLQSRGVENNLTMAEVPVEVPITSDDDSEQVKILSRAANGQF